jgi:ElaB/YqjD/DUF883 family membrane-anchored ribosome-binding protein
MMAKSFADQAGDYIGETARNVSQLGAAAADAVHEGVSSARRAVSDTRDAAGDFLNEAKRRVKRQPVESILLAAAIGIALGFLLGRSVNND